MTPYAFVKFADLLGPKRASELLGMTDPGLRYIMRKPQLKPVDELRMERALGKLGELVEEIRQS